MGRYMIVGWFALLVGIIGGWYTKEYSYTQEIDRLLIQYREATDKADALAVEHLQARNRAETAWFAIDNRTADLDALEEALGIYNDELTVEGARLEDRLRPVPNDMVLMVLDACPEFVEGEVLIERTSQLIGHVIGQIDSVRNLMLCMEYKGGDSFDHAWAYLNDAVSAAIMAQQWTIQAEEDG